MTEIMPVPRNLILLSYQQGTSRRFFFVCSHHAAALAAVAVGELALVIGDAVAVVVVLHGGLHRLLRQHGAVQLVGGLPAHKLHCSVLAEEAVKSAVKDYYDKNGIAYDKSKFPACEDCESCRMV